MGESIFGIKQNKQVCKSMHLNAVKKKAACLKHFLLFSHLDILSSAVSATSPVVSVGSAWPLHSAELSHTIFINVLDVFLFIVSNN